MTTLEQIKRTSGDTGFTVWECGPYAAVGYSQSPDKTPDFFVPYVDGELLTPDFVRAYASLELALLAALAHKSPLGGPEFVEYAARMLGLEVQGE